MMMNALTSVVVTEQVPINNHHHHHAVYRSFLETNFVYLWRGYELIACARRSETNSQALSSMPFGPAGSFMTRHDVCVATHR